MTTTIQTGMRQRTLPEGSLAGSPKRLARIAGLLYLVVGILGGFAFAAVYSTMYVAGDAASRLAARSKIHHVKSPHVGMLAPHVRSDARDHAGRQIAGPAEGSR